MEATLPVCLGSVLAHNVGTGAPTCASLHMQVAYGHPQSPIKGHRPEDLEHIHYFEFHYMMSALKTRQCALKTRQCACSKSNSTPYIILLLYEIFTSVFFSFYYKDVVELSFEQPQCSGHIFVLHVCEREGF